MFLHFVYKLLQVVGNILICPHVLSYEKNYRKGAKTQRFCHHRREAKSPRL